MSEDACGWERDLRKAGVELPQLNKVMNRGIPITALLMLAAVFIFAGFFRSTWFVIGMLGIATIPWERWRLRGDDGPTWTFGLVTLGPLAALGYAHWFAPSIGLRSDEAYVLLALSPLLVIALVVGFARPVLAFGLAGMGYLAYGGPLVAAALSGRLAEPLYPLLTWHAGAAFAIAAGYAVRLLYLVNAKVSEARESRARQEAADERREVARDVHDVVAHTLAVTMLHITAARMAVRRGSPEDAEEALTEAEAHGRASMTDIRRIVRALRSDDQTAVDAAQPGIADVEALAESYRAAGLPVELTLITPERAGPAAQLAGYRVLQEALANAARHGAGPATVDLRVSRGELKLRVDNPVHEPTAPGRGSGLVGMRERVSAAGGTVDAGVRDGSWVVRAVVPV